MFSAMASQPPTRTGSRSRAAATTVASTAAAPAMSHFISAMPDGGLDREAAGVEGDALADERHVAARVRSGAYSSWTSRGGRVEPWPTPRMPP